MTRPPGVARPRYLSEPARVVRRVLAPDALEVRGELTGLLAENQALRDRMAALEEGARRVEELTRQVAELQQDLHECRRLDLRVAELTDLVTELQQDLHESRRLNLRVAELTDLVTELVLPLHDRAIDPSVLSRLASDTR